LKEAAAASVSAESKAVKFGYLTGVIPQEEFHSFERVLWRSTRGNLYMRHAVIEEKIKDPRTGEMVRKNVFIIFFQGERAQMKIKKICQSFSTNMYNCPSTSRERKDMLNECNSHLEDLQLVLERTKTHRRQVLFEVAKHLKNWKTRIIKEKSIYHTMNLFNYDIGRKCLIAEGWCAKTSTEKIINAMRIATTTSGALVPSILSVVPASEEPPTYFKTNKFTQSFQSIVDAYGIAHYREINPGVFTIITFPFLFAVMFGDVGHGFLMTLFAVVLILKEKQLSNMKLNEMFRMCFDGRYLLLLMGAFSIYTGLIYNECFSVPLNLLGSNWEYVDNATITTRINPDRTYEFGVDPAWAGASNTLNFYNSFKMKLSIVLGVSQMCLGIVLSLFNGLYFRNKLDVYCEFVPQILFMFSLFGFMVFLIFLKWMIPGQEAMLLNVMINMFLSLTSISSANELFSGQLYVQWILIFIAFISVPWMLITKPYLLKKQHAQESIDYVKLSDSGSGRSSMSRLHRRSSTARAPASPIASTVPTEVTLDSKKSSSGDLTASNEGNPVEDDTSSESSSSMDEQLRHVEEFDFSEVVVHQIIHTIEFVLGAISNTASYLRLWALSLAHSELSIVFWDRMFLLPYIDMQGVSQVLGVFVSFACWSAATFGVLLIMESLSAFLHALRLHWVEFQNKFYRGDGRKFLPFSYEVILSGDTD